jgi:hypothetical protein
VAIELFYSMHDAEVFMPLNVVWSQEVVQCIVRLTNAWVRHLINLESHFEAFIAINHLVATLSPAGQAAAQTLRIWSRESCVAYPNANNLQNADILYALWTDITPYRPLMQYVHGLQQDLRRALPMPVPPIPQPVQQAMTPEDITQIIDDTNRRNAPARFSLSPLQTNQIRGYCGRTDPAYDSEELSEFYAGLAFVSKTDAYIMLYIDAFVSGEYRLGTSVFSIQPSQGNPS